MFLRGGGIGGSWSTVRFHRLAKVVILILILLLVTIIGSSWGLFGYDNSFLSSEMALPLFVKKYQGHGTVFNAFNLNLLTAVPMMGAALGSFISAPLQQKIGRKWTFLTAYTFFCIPGSLLQLFAPNMAAFVSGRLWNSRAR
jgi:MFS family permease